MSTRAKPCGPVGEAAMREQLRSDAEFLAARQVQSGRAGGDLTALLLDRICELRGEEPGRTYYRRWLVAAGFADGPEVA